MADYYVLMLGLGAQNGNDYANAKPYSWIQAAGGYWAGAAAGDVIHIGNACTGKLYILDKDYTAGAAITFLGEAYLAGVPSIIADADAAVYIRANAGACGGFVFQDLILTAGNGFRAVWLYDGGNVVSDITITDCTATSTDTATIQIAGDVTDITVSGGTYTTAGAVIVWDVITDSGAETTVNFLNATCVEGGATYGVRLAQNKANVTISGCTITGGTRGIFVSDGKDITLTDNTISGSSGPGIIIDDPDGASCSGDIVITGNTISNTTDRAMYIWEARGATKIWIENNYCHTVAGSGYIIEIEGEPANPVAEATHKGIYVLNNRVDCSTTPTGYGIVCKTSDYCTVMGNIAYGASGVGGSGIYFKGCISCYCYQNSIANCTTGVYIGKASTPNDWPAVDRNCAGIVVQNNAIANTTTPISIADANQGYTSDYNAYSGNTETHGLAVNPSFNNPAGGDFAIQNAQLYYGGKPDANDNGTAIGGCSPALGPILGERHLYSGYQRGWKP